MLRKPVSLAINQHGTIVVACDDGTCFIWGEAKPESMTPEEEMRRVSLRMSGQGGLLPHTWIPFHTPIPGSEAYAEYSEERTAR